MLGVGNIICLNIDDGVEVDKQRSVVVNRGCLGWAISIKMHLTRFVDDRDIVLLQLKSPPYKAAAGRFEVHQPAKGVMISHDSERTKLLTRPDDRQMLFFGREIVPLGPRECVTRAITCSLHALR